MQTFPYRPTAARWYSLLGPQTTMALHMAWGAANETMTHFVYTRLARTTKNETYRKLLEAIAKEELHHKAFYTGMARYLMERSGYARVVVPPIIAWRWRGVGADVISSEDGIFLTKFLMTGAEDQFIKAVSDYVQTIPGLSRFKGSEKLLRRAALLA